MAGAATAARKAAPRKAAKKAAPRKAAKAAPAEPVDQLAEPDAEPVKEKAGVDQATKAARAPAERPPKDAPRRGFGTSLPGFSAGGAVDQGAGFVLALLFWGWVALPFLRGGPAEVRKTIKAKFTNKAPDGSLLP